MFSRCIFWYFVITLFIIFWIYLKDYDAEYLTFVISTVYIF